MVDHTPVFPYPGSCIFMRWNRLSVLLPVCLMLLLLGAQLHFCGDFNQANAGSHVCQVCATAGHAVIAETLAADLAPAVFRLEVPCERLAPLPLFFSPTSPRAPPTVCSSLPCPGRLA